MFRPSSTYRLQFHKDFRFADLENIIPYLRNLGIKAIYASPIFKAIPGSTHGYDVTNPLVINPEIGTLAELRKLTAKLQQDGISWIQDIVPNHMAFHPANEWLVDVLEKWKDSAFFEFFDIGFSDLDDERLMVPFLGETIDEALAANKITISWSNEKPWITYGEDRWPINEKGKQRLGIDHQPLAGAMIDEALARINTDHAGLAEILAMQYYRLCYWRETETRINYRRFFTVNSLICMNMRNPEVFNQYHQLIKELIADGTFQGLRIDHVDGLADPKLYLETLRETVGSETYIVVEKILARGEELPANWPIQGATGYEFLAIINNLLTNQSSKRNFEDIYNEQLGKRLKPKVQALDKKREILHKHMNGELTHLVHLFQKIEGVNGDAVAETELKGAIAELLIHCPVYRYYPGILPLTQPDLQELADLVDVLKQTGLYPKGVALLSSAFAALRGTDVKAQAVVQFYQRCMQFSGPLMAKGVEDTQMYTYNRFISHAEVGDAPEAFGIETPDFHILMRDRLAQMPLGINGSSSHDTKRGEDVRARLNVLSDVPSLWNDFIAQLNQLLEHEPGIDLHPNDKYLFVQALVGAINYNQDPELIPRMENFVEKALRESKKRSDWAEPDADYEKKAKQFISRLLAVDGQAAQLLAACFKKIEGFAVINSLVQVLLKFTAPGIPDIYQGCELWDLSLVDPDNRRPVAYDLRAKYLKEIEAEVSLNTLWEERSTGKIKLWLTHELLNLRNRLAGIFENGAYLPLEVTGEYGKNVVAFARQHEGKWIIIAAALGLAKSCNGDAELIKGFDWKNTRIKLPAQVPVGWTNVLTKKSFRRREVNVIAISEIFTELPLAVLESGAETGGRGSGVLLPLYSLPTSFGIGDMGNSAYRFIETLCTAGQRYWQLLPLNPVSSKESFSPYSPSSAMAGNPLLISLELLAAEGLLTPAELEESKTGASQLLDYAAVKERKELFLNLAYEKFLELNTNSNPSYLTFCEQEAYWLTDYVLFQAITDQTKQPWSEWEHGLKFREQEALQSFEQQHEKQIGQLRWQQFVFDKQWKNLKKYANNSGVGLIGDMPFYLSYDSAEVWANPSLFLLDDSLEMEVVAGVPPDALSADGQRWGMPIFDWEKHKSEDYQWWLQRLAKNIAHFDIVRIDHFRAIHSYWQIPAADESAINGKWLDGPGAEFLDKVCSKFHGLPFVVEDLGAEMEGPTELREQYKLGGMKVLQFGFGDDMPTAVHLPHNFEDDNFVVYTGTHDNNTIRGWFMNEVDSATKARLSRYLDKDVNEANVNLSMIRLALSSNAKISIFQLQDLLGLDATARTNVPGTTEGNWTWVMNTSPTKELLNWLALQTLTFGR